MSIESDILETLAWHLEDAGNQYVGERAQQTLMHWVSRETGSASMIVTVDGIQYVVSVSKR